MWFPKEPYVEDMTRLELSALVQDLQMIRTYLDSTIDQITVELLKREGINQMTFDDV